MRKITIELKMKDEIVIIFKAEDTTFVVPVILEVEKMTDYENTIKHFYECTKLGLDIIQQKIEHEIRS